MRCSNSAARLPAKTRCVCASTNPGVTHLPPASITTAWGGMSGSSLTYGAAASTRPSSISSAASWINPSSRNSAPTRGRGGPAKVTNCPMLTIAMVIEVSRVGDPTSRTVSEPADLAKQRSILRIQRPAREHFCSTSYPSIFLSGMYQVEGRLGSYWISIVCLIIFLAIDSPSSCPSVKRVNRPE